MKVMAFSGKNIVVLGLSKSGISAAKYLSAQASVTISESRQPTDQDSPIIAELVSLGVKVEMGGNKKHTIEKCDLVVTSPGIPPSASVYEMIAEAQKPVISEIDVAFLSTEVPFIAITGTNGKTTTTKLTAEILQASGLKVATCGNIGTPPTSLLAEDLDYFVCEVSSYQIQTSQYFEPEIACFLNYSPDHIDWHGGEQAYFEAKKSLFEVARTCALNAKDARVASLERICKKAFMFGEKIGAHVENGVLKVNDESIMQISEFSLLGAHNLENILAAVCIANIIGLDKEAIKRVLRTFEPPEHRLEYVKTIGEKKYYNDSKATNVDASIKSIEAFAGQSLALIAGGKDKGTNLDDFVTTVQQHVDYVILIGEAKERFDAALKGVGYSSILGARTLEEAIDIAGSKDVENVLLAPACASFDMFKSFEDRGNAFKQYVLKKN